MTASTWLILLKLWILKRITFQKRWLVVKVIRWAVINWIWCSICSWIVISVSVAGVIITRIGVNALSGIEWLKVPWKPMWIFKLICRATLQLNNSTSKFNFLFGIYSFSTKTDVTYSSPPNCSGISKLNDCCGLLQLL